MNKITKAKLTKGRTVEVEMTEILDDHTENEVVKKCSQLAHDDLMKAFSKLKVHFVKLLDLYEGQNLSVEDFNIEDDLKNFEVMSFSLSGNDDQEGVTLSGMKRFNSGKVINLNTFFLKYSDEDEYIHASELAADIQTCIFEVEEYLNGKYAVKQLELQFGEEDGELSETKVTVEKKHKKGKGKTIEIYSTEPAPAFAEM